MKKMRFVSIMLGVLILLTGISGVALAQMSEEPVQEETITIPDYENFPFKHRLSLDIDKDGKVDYIADYYVERFETTDKRITLSKFLEESVAVPSDPTDEAVAVIRLKNAVAIRTSPHSAITLLAWIPGEVSLTVLDRPGVLAPPSRIIIKISDLDKMDSIARCAIKENGHQWKFIDEQTHSEKLAELKESIDAKLNIGTPEEESITIPDYENFPFKAQEPFDRDHDGNPEAMFYYYSRGMEYELNDQQTLATATLRDFIRTAGVRPSFRPELLIWFSEISSTFGVTEVIDEEAVNEESLNPEEILSIIHDVIINPERKLSIVRYAIKENGHQWKLVNEQTYLAKAKELMKIMGFNDE